MRDINALLPPLIILFPPYLTFNSSSFLSAHFLSFSHPLPDPFLFLSQLTLLSPDPLSAYLLTCQPLYALLFSSLPPSPPPLFSSLIPNSSGSHLLEGCGPRKKAFGFGYSVTHPSAQLHFPLYPRRLTKQTA